MRRIKGSGTNRPRHRAKIVKERVFTRRFTKRMGDALKGFRIRHGTGRGKEVCVMQTVALLTGQHGNTINPTDHPMCVSEEITSFAISVNDSRRDREIKKEDPQKERNKLKRIVPVIMGTRPLKRIEYDNGDVFETIATTDGYLEAERVRARILREECTKLRAWRYGAPQTRKLATKDAMRIIRKMAAVPNNARALKKAA